MKYPVDGILSYDKLGRAQIMHLITVREGCFLGLMTRRWMGCWIFRVVTN